MFLLNMSSFFSKIKFALQQYKILTSIIFSFILIASALIFSPFRFEENDDIIMLLLASGNYTGDFESNLIFINPIYGFIVSGLYQLIKGVEWYTFLFVFFHLISFSIVIHYVISLLINNRLKLILVILLSVIELNLIMYLQFTTVSILLTLAGIILFSKSNKIGLISSFFFILLAGLIRYEAVLLILLLFFPYYIYDSLKSKKANKIIIYISFLLIVVSVRYISYGLMSKEWKEFTEFNKLRGKVTDNPNADLKTSIYKDICTKEDYLLLKKYFPDPSVFSNSKMEKLVENVQIKNDYKIIVKNVINQIKDYKHELIILFFIVVFVLIGTRTNFPNKYVYMYVLFVLSVLIFISMDGLLKNRVFIGVLLSAILLFMFTLEKMTNNFYINCISILFIVLSVFYVRRLSEKIEETNFIRINSIPHHISIINDFFDKEPDKYLIPFGDDLRVQYINPFHISKTVKNWNLFYLGWMTKSPHNNSIMNSFSFFRKDGFIYISRYNYNVLCPLIKDSTTQYIVY